MRKREELRVNSREYTGVAVRKTCEATDRLVFDAMSAVFAKVHIKMSGEASSSIA